MKIFAIIIVAVTSLAVAGMSFGKPPSKRTGPLKQKTPMGTGLGSGPASNFLTGLNTPYGPHKHLLYKETSRRRAERLYQYRYPNQYPNPQLSHSR